MQFQACTYKTSADAPRREGIAKMNSGFGTYDAAWIVDGETGEKIAAESLYNYDLDNEPLRHIDTAYHG